MDKQELLTILAYIIMGVAILSLIFLIPLGLSEEFLHSYILVTLFISVAIIIIGKVINIDNYEQSKELEDKE